MNKTFHSDSRLIEFGATSQGHPYVIFSKASEHGGVHLSWTALKGDENYGNTIWLSSIEIEQLYEPSKMLDELKIQFRQQMEKVFTEKRPVFSGATCRGSYSLGTACGHCERCEQDPMNPNNHQKTS